MTTVPRGRGKVVSDMGLDVDPCESFYDYACTGFINNPLHPQDTSFYDQGEVLDTKKRVFLKQVRVKQTCHNVSTMNS